MGIRSRIAATVLLASSTVAQQIVTYSSGGHQFTVNIPSDTASSGSGPIYFQISAPSGTQWTAFGQGNRMVGSNIFVVYTKDSTNVTLSARLGTGHFMPQHTTDTQVTLLEGSGVNKDGSFLANVRCDNCNSWNGGSMSFTDTSSSWIHAMKTGSALKSDDVSASISQHDIETTFSLDLTQGTGGSSTNPFAATSTSSPGASGAGATPSSTNGVSNPVASGPSTSSSSSSSSISNVVDLRHAHGIIMSVLFVGLFPLISLTLYLPYAGKVRYIHAPLQILGAILLIVGMSLGIVVGNKMGQLNGYHMIIGFIVVACLVLFQPALGIYQHLYYHRTGGRSSFAIVHRWLGRSLITLGIINGGLGWMFARETSAYIPYGIVVGIMCLVYVSVLFFAWHRSGQLRNMENEKTLQQSRGYEMQQPRAPRHERLPSDLKNAYAEQQRMNSSGPEYAISARR